MIANIGLVGLAGRYEIGFDSSLQLTDECSESLIAKGFHIHNSKTVIFDKESLDKSIMELKPIDVDLLVVVVGTWSEDHYLLDLLEHVKCPVAIWAFPAVDTGSLCGEHQICYMLKELNYTYWSYYGMPNNRNIVSSIHAISKGIALTKAMRFTKIGCIGGRVNGMMDVAYDEFTIKQHIGTRIVGIDEVELTDAFEAVTLESAKKKWTEIKEIADKVCASDSDGIVAMRYYYALKTILKKYDLDGMTIKCYPRFMGKICTPYSLLSDEGYVMGCEGDINGTVVMKLLFELSNKPIINTDLLYDQDDQNTILFSHCGSGSFSLADKKNGISLSPVRLANDGVCSLFTAKPGPVTLVNLVGRKDSYRLTLLKGKAVETSMIFPGNPVNVTFEKPVKQINHEIATNGVGHHWMVAYGLYEKELEVFCSLNKITLNIIT